MRTPHDPAEDSTPQETMAVVASRLLHEGAVCFVGIGLPSLAANLARHTHAPGLVLVYESGTIGSKPHRLPLSIGDGDLAETADTVVSVPEIFAYWVQAGRIDVAFLGAAQIDRFGNLNSTAIGSYEDPKVRLPGAGGAPEIAANCPETFVIIQQSTRTFVHELDFRTTLGRGVTRVVTDRGVLAPDGSGELVLTHLHPGVELEAAKAATGWPLRVSEALEVTEPPTPEEVAALRALQAAR
jgi:glutaconate CoA-transferase subunit B